MGALTINHKRGQARFTQNHGCPPLLSPNSSSHIDLHVSKKPKFSYLRLDQPLASKSAPSLLSRYPQATSRLKREVHAPCRVVRYGVSLGLSRERQSKASGSTETTNPAESMDTPQNFNALRERYELAKRQVLDSFRYNSKDKEVIEVDDEPEKDTDSDDSSVEELEIDGNEREVEGGSVVSDHRYRETNSTAENAQGTGSKIVERQYQPSSSSAVTDDMQVDNAEKMLDMLSLNNGAEVLRVPLYEKLLKSAERRNCKLNDIKFLIQLFETQRSSLSLTRPTKKPDKDIFQKAFVPLSEEEEAEVSRAFCARRRTVLVTHESSNLAITVDMFQCLRPGAWLNDEVINVYLELLKEREKREPTKFLKCHFFNTFFYKKLISDRSGYDYKSVRRWTTQRKLGYSLAECDKIFVPIHKEIHWCLAVINKKDQKFQYLDSLKGVDTRVLKVLAKYYADEVKDKGGENVDVSAWEHECVDDLPAQQNGYDCGMFMIKFADFYSRGLDLCFEQEHMPYFRRRTAKEILKLRAD